MKIDRVKGTIKCNNVKTEAIGTTDIMNQCEWNNSFGSAGQRTGGIITDAGSETVNVSAGTGFIKANDDDTDTLLAFSWEANNGISIPTNSTRFIGVKYNDGTPIVDSRVSQNWDLDTEFPLGSVINLNGILYILNNPWWVTDGITNIIEKSVGLGGYLARDNFVGGLILGVTGTRNPTMTAGTLWGRTNEFEMTEIDYSTPTGSFYLYWFESDGTVHEETNGGAGYTQYPITQWNDINNDQLDTIGNNKYAVWWVFLNITNNELSFIYPSATYANSASAEAEEIPSHIPGDWFLEGVIIGRIIFQQGNDTPIEVQSTFNTTFTAALAADHGNLTGLSDDDHIQYLLANGSRAMTGALDMGTHLINNVVDPVSNQDAATKKYVDDNVTAQDLDFAGDAGTGAVDLDSQSLTIAGTTNEIETSASDQTITIGLPNNVNINSTLTANTLTDGTASMVGGNLTNITNIGTTSGDTDLLVLAPSALTINGRVVTLTSYYSYERASASTDFAGYGQLWVKNDVPNTLWFTDDTGVDFQLGVGTNLTGLGTDNRLARWNGNDTLQDSGITIDDSDNVSGIGTLGCGAITSTGNLDIGANTFTVNSIEIVGSDGEVNKAVVEDSSNWDTAYTHSQDNTQAHSDYLINNGNDTMAGVLTCDGITMGANENLTMGSETLDYNGTNFVFSDDIDFSSSKIVSTSNADIEIEPNGTGSLVIDSQVTTGTTTSAGIHFDLTDLTTGDGIYFETDSSLTTGKIINIEAKNLDGGYGIYMSVDRDNISSETYAMYVEDFRDTGTKVPFELTWDTTDSVWYHGGQSAGCAIQIAEAPTYTSIPSGSFCSYVLTTPNPDEVYWAVKYNNDWYDVKLTLIT